MKITSIIFRCYGLLLLMLTPVLWTIFDNPAKWEPGEALFLVIAGCVIPVVGLGFLIGGKAFYVAMGGVHIRTEGNQ